MKHGKILLVDDNRGIRNALGLLLPAHFAQVELIPSPKTLVSTMESFRPDVVLLDMNFAADIALAVEGMKRGAFDFIVKPWDNAKLLSTLRAACQAASNGSYRAFSGTVTSRRFTHSAPAEATLWSALT